MSTDKQRCLTCRKFFNKETDWNKMRAEILTRDRIEGKRTITIAETTHDAIQELSSQRSGATYDVIILAALSSYKREQENNFNGNDPQSAIVTNDEQED